MKRPPDAGPRVVLIRAVPPAVPLSGHAAEDDVGPLGRPIQQAVGQVAVHVGRGRDVAWPRIRQDAQFLTLLE